MNFSGKNVLITGSSRGIGADIARGLAKYGLKVWINYKSSASLADELKDEIISNGGEAGVIGFDASNEQAFIDAIKVIVESDGELSYLINNAGITNDKLALRMSLEDFNSVINANLGSTFIGCKSALKVMMKKKFGAIVNISSIVSEGGNAGQVNYSASKGGINTLTKSFAKESASRGIRYNAVAPGFIKTDMTDKLPDNVKEEYQNNIPLKRFGNPSEVASVCAFLLSDEASYITGAIIRVNGGLYM